ncbi:type II secretion system protein GspD [Salmonella enterica]|nr:secretin [Salmonella enterica subsp. enterica]EAA2696277.1 type II secretion system protein GspD [Salmonella enterica]ECL7192003.1 type II secretion system protein GspD [Salmonella enterica subsp. enterica serovar Muenchen]EHF3500573.1 type II secretion system protein GspD [Salmonella enterica subsp. enterica serovar 6,8,20:d-]HBJ6609024.1 type II secretion system protein GspD [Salmonella enterica subsp. enterica serovar 6,8:d:-]
MKLITALLFLLIPGLALAKGVSLELNAVPLPQALNMIYVQVFDKPFMLDPELAKSDKLVTFRITPDIDERAFIKRYLGNMNITIYNKQGIDYVAPFTPKAYVPPQETFVYRPRFRSVAYLSDILAGQFTGQFNSQRNSLPSGQISPEAAVAGTASDFMNRTGDVLVYYGRKSEIKRLQTLLPLIDTASEEVIVAAYVFEVQTSERNGSGLALAAKLLSGKLNIQTGISGGFDNFIRVNTGSLDALYELFRTDSRFHVVSSPRLRVKDGASATFSVGNEVPVLGQVSYADNRPIQSIEYRSSGVILDVRPQIRTDNIDLVIKQQLSSFAKTDTGVNNSPTLIKREVNTEVSAADGDIILLGGLAETKVTNADTGFSFLPKGWFTSSSDEKNKTDILVVLQAKKVSRTSAAHAPSSHEERAR